MPSTAPPSTPSLMPESATDLKSLMFFGLPGGTRNAFGAQYIGSENAACHHVEALGGQARDQAVEVDLLSLDVLDAQVGPDLLLHARVHPRELAAVEVGVGLLAGDPDGDRALALELLQAAATATGAAAGVRALATCRQQARRADQAGHEPGALEKVPPRPAVLRRRAPRDPL